MKMLFIKALVIVSAMIGSLSYASTWAPDKKTSIEIVSGFPPGGTNFAVAQLFSDYLKSVVDQTNHITIKPGAGGVVASNYFLNKPADGTSVMLVVGLGMLVHPEITTDQVSRQTLEDFEPVTIFGKTPSILVTRSENANNTMEKFVSLGNKKISIGYTTLTQELIAKSVGKSLTNVVYIPYKSSADVTKDLLGGSLDYAIVTNTSSGALIESGKLSALGTTQVNSSIPEFDKKYNLLGRNFGAIVGLVLPKNTPQPIINFYLQTTKSFIETNKDKLNQLHMYLGDSEFGPAFFKSDMIKLNNIVKSNK